MSEVDVRRSEKENEKKKNRNMGANAEIFIRYGRQAKEEKWENT